MKMQRGDGPAEAGRKAGQTCMARGLFSARPSFRARFSAALLITALLVASAVVRPAPALACGGCACVVAEHALDRSRVSQRHTETREFIKEEFRKQVFWIFNDFFIDHILPAMMHMTEQLAVTGMHQMFILGTYFDAENTLIAQRLIQEKTAEAHKDYQPSMDMCVFGTNVKSLPAAQRNADLNRAVMTSRGIDRALGQDYTIGSAGEIQDRKSRFDLFKRRYCDIRANNEGLKTICGASADSKTINRDIDYTAVIDNAHTLDVDFSDTDVTSDETDILALSNNLFGDRVFTPFDKQIMARLQGMDEMTDMRAIVAKRAVAANSFNTIVGLKSAGSQESEETKKYMAIVLKQFGLENQEEIDALLGKRPSYFAQLELLAQKIYQNPAFYVNLYDKPANVHRKEAAMQAIGLMLDRDAYKSELRTESVLAVLLELEMAAAQSDVQNKIGGPDVDDAQRSGEGGKQ